jgi:uncharacterized protein (TIGR00369 family)
MAAQSSAPDASIRPTVEQVLQRWQDDEARIRAVPRSATFGVARKEDLIGLSGLEQLQAMLDGKLPAPSINQTMDFLLIEVARGVATFQGQPTAKVLNPMGTVHGGWYATLLDSAVGCAVHTAMPAGRGYTTLELKLNIVRAVSLKVPLLRAIGRTIHVGRQVATAQGELVGPDGTLYAHATTTCLVFDAKP